MYRRSGREFNSDRTWSVMDKGNRDRLESILRERTTIESKFADISFRANPSLGRTDTCIRGRTSGRAATGAANPVAGWYVGISKRNARRGRNDIEYYSY